MTIYREPASVEIDRSHKLVIEAAIEVDDDFAAMLRALPPSKQQMLKSDYSFAASRVFTTMLDDVMSSGGPRVAKPLDKPLDERATTYDEHGPAAP